MDYYAFDFETRYDNERSVTIMGARSYAEALCSPEHGSGDDIYLISCHGPAPGAPGGRSFRDWVGHPKRFPWDWWREKGRETGIVAHNLAFDWPILWRCVQLGYAPEWVLELPSFCSADCCAYHQYSRSLAGAVKAVFKKTLSKAMRNWMKGKTWDDAVREGKSDELRLYGLEDSEWCWKLWMKLYPTWPESERALSRLTREMGWLGVPVESDKLDKKYDELDRLRWDKLQQIPWVGEKDLKYKKEFPPTSKRGLAMECRKHGIEPPVSVAEDSPEYLEWVARHGDEYPFVEAMTTYNKVNVQTNRLKAMRDRVYFNESGDTRMAYGLKYWGAATTGRWAGDTGFNVQNMPRNEKFGVNVRHCIEAPEGKTFVICDKSQIEPRLLARVVGDYKFLNLVSEGYNPYEAHARLTMGWEGGDLKTEDPGLYVLAKIRVLQLGYGSGWMKFFETVRAYDQLHILDAEPTKEQIYVFGTFIANHRPDAVEEWQDLDDATKRHWVNAHVQVSAFRRSNPKITSLWRTYDREFRSTLVGDMEVKLLNNESFGYYRIRPEAKGNSCITRRGDLKRSWFYGSMIVENRIQREARNCFAEDLLKLNEAGHRVVLHVHDEVVVECDEFDAKRVVAEVREIMSAPPSWLDRCPLDASAIVSKKYVK